MKSIFTVATLLGVATSMTVNSEHYPVARRLDTNTNAFGEEDSFIQTEQ